MINRLILTIFVLLSIQVEAQIDAQLDMNGEYMTVVSIADSTIDLYQKTKDWIISSYVNPSEVIVADEKNEYIKISAHQPASEPNPGFYYTLLFEFKKGRYRLTYHLNKLYVTGKYASNWTYDSYFNKSKGVVRSLNEPKVRRIKNLIDDLLENHYDHLNTANSPKDDDW